MKNETSLTIQNLNSAKALIEKANVSIKYAKTANVSPYKTSFIPISKAGDE